MITSTEESPSAYPTESRIIQKAKAAAAKEAGIEIIKKKRFKHIEPGIDDLGGDISSIDFFETEPLAFFDCGFVGFSDGAELNLFDEELEAYLVQVEADMTPYHTLLGSCCPSQAQLPTSFIHYSDMNSFLHY